MKAIPMYRIMHRFKDAQQSLRVWGTHDWRAGTTMYGEENAINELRYRKQSNAMQDFMLWKITEKVAPVVEEELNDSLPDFLTRQPDNYAEMIARAADKQAQIEEAKGKYEKWKQERLEQMSKAS